MSWNYRVFRETRVELGEEIAFYIIKRAYYEGGAVTKWTDGDCAPCGNTIEELSGDLAWMIKALTLPVLDFRTAQEIAPALYLADELTKAVSENPQDFPAILSRSVGQA